MNHTSDTQMGPDASALGSSFAFGSTLSGHDHSQVGRDSEIGRGRDPGQDLDLGQGPTAGSPGEDVPVDAIEFRVIRAGAPVRRLRLTGKRYTFGSTDGCSIRLNDPAIRPMHAVLIRDSQKILVRAYSVPLEVNDRRTTESTLVVGDVLRVGAYRFELLSVGEPSQTAPSTMPARPEHATENNTTGDAADSKSADGDVSWRDRLRREVEQWRDRQVECDRRESRCDDREANLRGRESELWVRAEQLYRRESHLQSQEAAAMQIHEEFAQKQQELISLREETYNRQQAYEHRENEFRSLENQFQQQEAAYQRQVDEATRQLHQSQKQAAAATDAVQRMRDQFLSLNVQIEELSSQQDRFQNEEETQRQEHRQLRRDLELARDEAIDAKAESEALRQRAEERVEQMTTELETLTSERAYALDENQTLRAEYNVEREAAEALINEVTSELEALKAQHESAIEANLSRLSASDALREQAESRIEEMTAELDTLRADYEASLENLRSEHDSQIEAKQTLVAQRETERQEAESRIEELAAQLEELKAERDAQLAASLTQLASSESERSEAEALIKEMTAQLDALKSVQGSEVETHQSRLAESEAQRQRADARVEDLAAQLDAIHAERSTDSDASQSRLAESEAAAGQLREQVEQLQSIVDQAQQETDQLRVDYQDACESVRDLERLVSDGNERGDQDRASWEAEAEQLRLSVEQLSVDLARANGELSELRDANTALSERLDDMRRQRDDFQADADARPTDEAWQSLHNELDQANDKLASLKQEYDETLATLETAAEQEAIQRAAIELAPAIEQESVEQPSSQPEQLGDDRDDSFTPDSISPEASQDDTPGIVHETNEQEDDDEAWPTYHSSDSQETPASPQPLDMPASPESVALPESVGEEPIPDVKSDGETHATSADIERNDSNQDAWSNASAEAPLPEQPASDHTAPWDGVIDAAPESTSEQNEANGDPGFAAPEAESDVWPGQVSEAANEASQSDVADEVTDDSVDGSPTSVWNAVPFVDTEDQAAAPIEPAAWAADESNDADWNERTPTDATDSAWQAESPVSESDLPVAESDSPVSESDLPVAESDSPVSESDSLWPSEDSHPESSTPSAWQDPAVESKSHGASSWPSESLWQNPSTDQPESDSHDSENNEVTSAWMPAEELSPESDSWPAEAAASESEFDLDACADSSDEPQSHGLDGNDDEVVDGSLASLLIKDLESDQVSSGESEENTYPMAGDQAAAPWDNEHHEEAFTSSWSNDAEGHRVESIDSDEGTAGSVEEASYDNNESDAVDPLAGYDRFSSENDEGESPESSYESSATASDTVAEPDTVADPEDLSGLSSEGGADDDSIEAYMNRLLQRVQGDDDTEPQTAALSTSRLSDPLTESNSVDDPTEIPVETRPLDPDTPLVPRSEAPEKHSDLSAMRKLANDSARSAITRSARLQSRDTQMKGITKFAFAAVAMICGFLCFIFIPGAIRYLAVTMTVVVSGVCVHEGFQLFGAARNCMAGTGEASEESDAGLEASDDEDVKADNVG